VVKSFFVKLRFRL